MRTWIKSSLATAWLGCVAGGSIVSGQVVERDTKLTGPRGRTIERSIRTERGPGFVDRQVEIKRPGETLIRDTRIQQPGGFGPRTGFAPGPPRRQFVERDFVVERPALIAPFVAPFLSFSFGAPQPPPPPPVVYVPEPVYVATPAVVTPPQFMVASVPPLAPPGPVVVEPPLPPQVGDAIGRLASFHHQSRRDGALTLGHLGDSRAVGPLVDRLEHDLDREVRVAAAWSLGEIADPRAAIPLERAALYDKRQEVRDAANNSYRRLPRPGQQPVGAAPATTRTIVSQPTSPGDPRSTPAKASQVEVDPGPDPTSSTETPPPFPAPASAPESPR